MSITIIRHRYPASGSACCVSKSVTTCDFSIIASRDAARIAASLIRAGHDLRLRIAVSNIAPITRNNSAGG
jgi:hypothetical protein